MFFHPCLFDKNRALEGVLLFSTDVKIFPGQNWIREGKRPFTENRAIPWNLCSTTQIHGQMSLV